MNSASRQRWLVVAAIAVAGLFVSDRFVLTPLASLWSARSERISSLRTELTDDDKLLRRTGDVARRWKEMNGQSLPRDQGAAEGIVLKSVNEWASAGGLAMSAIRPRWQTDSEPPTLECTASWVGSMRAVAEFLYALETGPLPLRIEEIGLVAEDDNGKKLRLDLRFTGIILKGAQS